MGGRRPAQSPRWLGRALVPGSMKIITLGSVEQLTILRQAIVNDIVTLPDGQSFLPHEDCFTMPVIPSKVFLSAKLGQYVVFIVRAPVIALVGAVESTNNTCKLRT